MDAFKLRYQEFVKKSYPTGLAGEEINGIELVLLDSAIAGLVEKFIINKGKLGVANFKLFIGLNKDLNSVLTALEGVQRAYFLNLSNLSNEVITRLNQEEK